jgi:hypothetical protein
MVITVGAINKFGDEAALRLKSPTKPSAARSQEQDVPGQRKDRW